MKKAFIDPLTGEPQSFGDRVANMVANGMGSWRFIIVQTIVIAIWIFLNVLTLRGFRTPQWDPYPFILLNLAFSFQAAYTGPILQMTGNQIMNLVIHLLQKIVHIDEQEDEEIKELAAVQKEMHLLVKEIHENIVKK